MLINEATTEGSQAQMSSLNIHVDSFLAHARYLELAWGAPRVYKPVATEIIRHIATDLAGTRSIALCDVLFQCPCTEHQFSCKSAFSRASDLCHPVPLF